MATLEPFLKTKSIKPKLAIFLSGTGTNALNVLTQWQKNKNQVSYEPVCLVSDRDCNAENLAKEFSLPLIKINIFSFYQKHQLKTIKLNSKKALQIRKLWTQELVKNLKKFNIDFGVFAGFIPLSNITKYFPCLNIHPGDLSYQVNGERVLTGLHTLPIYKAVQEGLKSLRSSVILANAYTKTGGGMDTGTILALSEAISIDFLGKNPKNYQEKKLLEIKDFLKHNLKKLKEQGDWTLFPQIINDFAKKKFFFRNKQKKIYFKLNEKKFVKIHYIIYSKDNKELVLNEN